jgi:hypothetical protein
MLPETATREGRHDENGDAQNPEPERGWKHEHFHHSCCEEHPADRKGMVEGRLAGDGNGKPSAADRPDCPAKENKEQRAGRKVWHDRFDSFGVKRIHARRQDDKSTCDFHQADQYCRYKEANNDCDETFYHLRDSIDCGTEEKQFRFGELLLA